MAEFISPVPPRPRVRLMPTSAELVGPRFVESFKPNQPVRDEPLSGLGTTAKPRLFESEDGGREPVEPGGIGPRPVSADLANRFGFSWGTATPQTDDRAARAGVLSRGYTNSLSDPGADRRAERNAGIAMENAIAGEGDLLQPMQTPTSRESALERDYLQAQVAPAERADAKRAQDIAAARTGLIADAEAAAAVQRQAAKLAWEETYQMPYSEEAAKDIAEQVRKNDEDAGLMADLSDMKADMDAELAEVDSVYPPDPMNPTAPTNVARQREQDRIRQKYMLDMNHLLTVRTRRNIEMGKKGQAPPVTEDDLSNFGVR